MQQELKAAEGSEGHLAMWLAGQHSMQETAAEIDQLMQVITTCCTRQLHQVACGVAEACTTLSP